MTERLSSPTLSGTVRYLSGCLLVGGVYVGIGLSQHQPLYGLAGLGWLVLSGLKAYRLWLYEVTITATSIHLKRLFAAPVSYRLSDFVDLLPTSRFGRPLRLCLADGRSFLFQAKLKESSFSFHYTSLPDFAAYWREELAERAAQQPAPAS